MVLVVWLENGGIGSMHTVPNLYLFRFDKAVEDLLGLHEMVYQFRRELLHHRGLGDSRSHRIDPDPCNCPLRNNSEKYNRVIDQKVFFAESVNTLHTTRFYPLKPYEVAV